MTSVDSYIQDVIHQGNEGSALLAARCAPTLKNVDYVQVLSYGKNGIAVLRVPDSYDFVVHSATGDPGITDPEKYTISMIDNLYAQAREIAATPIGMANVVDASKGDRETVEAIAGALANGANKYGFAVMNGELAILGDRISCPANIFGTMISLKKTGRKWLGPYINDSLGDGSWSTMFHPEGAIYMNSDGVGTKTEFYERSGKYEGALMDSLAMKLDDAVKIGATPIIVFDVLETKGSIYAGTLDTMAGDIGRRMGFPYRLHFVPSDGRLGGWSPHIAYNISGSAVNVIDEERLMSPPAPQEGDYVIAIRGEPNPRSNGITDKRKAMIKQFGNNWHETLRGKVFLEFLAQPSTIFYPVFRELLNERTATSVYHMSGGAYEGKLAKPLAEHGLYARLEGLFEPDWRELALAGFLLTPAEAAYAKWPMGNEGFVTTNDPEKAMNIIAGHKLESRVVGRLEKTDKTGVELAGIKGSDGRNVYFSGK